MNTEMSKRGHSQEPYVTFALPAPGQTAHAAAPAQCPTQWHGKATGTDTPACTSKMPKAGVSRQEMGSLGLTGIPTDWEYGFEMHLLKHSTV